MDDYKLKIGDFVHVDFNNAQTTLSHKAELLCIPCATGDSWIFRDVATNQIHYVSEGCTVTKLSENKCSVIPADINPDYEAAKGAHESKHRNHSK